MKLIIEVPGKLYINKSTQELVFIKPARLLLEELLQNNFAVLSTRLHLARLALITDNLVEAAQHFNEVWKTRKEAKNYVVARILWFKLCLEYMNTKAKQSTGIFGKIKSLYKKEERNETIIILSQLKAILQKEDAFMEWTMQPVLDHLKPKLTEQQHKLLSGLVDYMSYKQNLEKLNDFEEWRDAKPEKI
jgi:hypothetical protein